MSSNYNTALSTPPQPWGFDGEAVPTAAVVSVLQIRWNARLPNPTCGFRFPLSRIAGKVLVFYACCRTKPTAQKHTVRRRERA